MPTQAKKSGAKPPAKEPERPKSRDSSRAGSRGSTTTSKVKESAVVSDGSLSILAREIAKEKEDGLVLAMFLRSTTTSKVKESAVISDGSLSILAREIAKEKEDGLVLAMYLCIPNTTIVHACNSASEVGLKDASEQLKIETCQSLLLTWKGLKAGCKEREKVRELERALREMGKTEMADVINDKHANNVELTVEALAV